MAERADLAVSAIGHVLVAVLGSAGSSPTAPTRRTARGDLRERETDDVAVEQVVGTFAVQIAAALGAEMHAVCSGRNVVRSGELGATRVFDDEREDFTRSGEWYDVLLDAAGSRSWRSMRRVLA